MSIKKLQNNYTTVEQSKRLLELGVPADSADCYYFSQDSDVPLIRKGNGVPLFPCWSVGRLIEIMSICGNINRVKRFNIEKVADFCRSAESSIVDLAVDDIENLVKSGDIDFSKLEE